MIKSMTGFGRGACEDKIHSFKVEIKAVNHRYNDISVKMPRHISYLEEKIKKMVKEKINRGKVDVYINLDYSEDSSTEIKVNIPLAKSYKAAFEQVSNELGLMDGVDLSNILSISDIIKTEKKEIDEDIIWNSLKEALEIALLDISKMKKTEGQALKLDMEKRLKLIETIVLDIEKRSPKLVEDYKNKLSQRVEALLDQDMEIYEERIAQEVVFFADKSNIDEEIVRLKSHISQFSTILDEGELIGRKLDFLIQEMNREINTVGSKANDMYISQDVVEVKSEIEKIREQVQNLE